MLASFTDSADLTRLELEESTGLAGSLASTGRQAGTTLGVAISGTVIGPSLTRGGTALTSAAIAPMIASGFVERDGTDRASAG